MDLKELVGRLRLVGLRQDQDYTLLIEDLKESKNKGQRVYITFLCCPDYSYNVDNSGWAIFDYKHLNMGVGMMGLIYTKAFIEIVSKVIEYEATVKITFAYGDNEVDDLDRLNLLKLSPAEFLHKVQCSESTANIFFNNLLQEWYKEQQIDDKNTIIVDSVGMKKKFYTEEIITISKQKIQKLNQEEITDLIEKRKNVIESTYQKEYTSNKDFFYAKTKEQVLDRVVVGTALSKERDRGKKTILVSQSILSMMSYFNLMNNTYVPSLGLGTTI